MLFEWDSQKNEKLKQERDVSFEDIASAIENNLILGQLYNPKYPQQNSFLVNINQYAWVVPTEQRGDKLRLITAFPSRAFTKKYL